MNPVNAHPRPDAADSDQPEAALVRALDASQLEQ